MVADSLPIYPSNQLNEDSELDRFQENSTLILLFKTRLAQMVVVLRTTRCSLRDLDIIWFISLQTQIKKRVMPLEDRIICLIAQMVRPKKYQEDRILHEKIP